MTFVRASSAQARLGHSGMGMSQKRTAADWRGAGNPDQASDHEDQAKAWGVILFADGEFLV